MTDARTPLILLAEDDEDHAYLMTLALEALALPLRLAVVKDGQECLRYLRAEGEHAGTQRPDMLLLDVNMPRMDGFETLEAIRSDVRLRTLVVIAMSTSADPRDVRRMYRRGCNAYLAKPLDFDRFVETMRRLHAFWLDMAVLDRPGAEGAAPWDDSR